MGVWQLESLVPWWSFGCSWIGYVWKFESPFLNKGSKHLLCCFCSFPGFPSIFHRIGFPSFFSTKPLEAFKGGGPLQRWPCDRGTHWPWQPWRGANCGPRGRDRSTLEGNKDLCRWDRREGMGMSVSTTCWFSPSLKNLMFPSKPQIPQNAVDCLCYFRVQRVLSWPITNKKQRPIIDQLSAPRLSSFTTFSLSSAWSTLFDY